MARICNAKGRDDGGFYRILGNKSLGLLLSKTQATLITAGTELEKIIINKSNQITDVDMFLKTYKKHNFGTFVITKKSLKLSSIKNNQEPDILVMSISYNSDHCYIIEIKDGDQFDTKKSQAEKEGLILFQNHISKFIPCTSSIHFCCFNANTRQEIVYGFKNKITEQEALTGKELCDILNINFEQIKQERTLDQEHNLQYFKSEINKIPELK